MPICQIQKNKSTSKKYTLKIQDSVKRIQRVVTDHGTEIGIRLKQPIDLQYGDILYADDHNMIIVDVNSEDLLVIQPRTLQELNIALSIRKSSFASTIYRD